jgi:hypothetical protein
MAIKDRADLTTEAQQIKTETVDNANTATRVGQMLQDLVDSQMNLDDDSSIYDQRAAVAALQAAIPVLNAYDFWEMQPTAAGHTVPVGQEVYIPCINISAVAATTLEPKLFLLGKADINEPEFQDCTVAAANDLSANGLFGINTTEALALTGKTDIVLFGTLHGVKTDQWSVGSILYAGTTPGELTAVMPEQDIYPVARVEMSDATVGIIFVFSIRTGLVELLGKAQGTQRVWFTGDEETTTEGTFYKAQLEDKGTVPVAAQSVAVDDDQTVALPEDLLDAVYQVTTSFEVGIYTALLDYSVDSSLAFDKLTIEYYLADDQGVVIDSGSGLPNGSYPFPPIVVLESPLLDSASGVSLFANLSGKMDFPLAIAIGQRVRTRVLCSKVGTTGASKTFTVNYGSDHLSFATIPKAISLGDLSNVQDDSVTGDILRKGSDDIWRNHAGNIDDTDQLPSIADVAAYSGLLAGDVLIWQSGGFWMNEVNPSFLKTDYISAFDGNPNIPVVTGADGKIAGDLLDVNPISFVGDWTPTAGNEYPPAPAASDVWIVVDVGLGYLFVGGDLAGQTAYESSWMEFDGANWILLNNSAQNGILPSQGLIEDVTFPTNEARNYSVLTQAEYDSIGTPDATTLYFIIA